MPTQKSSRIAAAAAMAKKRKQDRPVDVAEAGVTKQPMKKAPELAEPTTTKGQLPKAQAAAAAGRKVIEQTHELLELPHS